MSHREWNPKSFFRQITPDALSHLVQQPFLLLALDGRGSLGEQAYRAWSALPDRSRQRAEAELLPLNDLSAPHARPYLEDLARSVWAGKDSLQAMRDWSVQDLAVYLFVEDAANFAEMHRRYALDLSAPLIEFRGRYPVAPKATAARKARLTRKLPQCLQVPGAGARCHVEDFSNETKLVLVIFHEGELSVFDQFSDNGTIEPSWSRPVHRLVLVFHFDTSTLLIRSCRWLEAEKLSALFAEIYAGDAAYFEDVSRSPRFCFNVLRDPLFHFPTRAADQIEAVSLVRVVARHSHHAARRAVVDLEPKLSLEAAHRTLAEHGVDISSTIVDSVRLQIRYQGIGRARIRTVHLANPNTSNLNDTDRDRVLRGYLQEWGIDAALRHTVASSVLEPAVR